MNYSAFLPVVRDPDGKVYFREWNGGVFAGGFESVGKPVFHNSIPEKFEFQLLPEDWDHFRKSSSTVLTLSSVTVIKTLHMLKKNQTLIYRHFDEE